MDGQGAIEKRPRAEVRDRAAASEANSGQTWLTQAHTLKCLSTNYLSFQGYQGEGPLVVFSFSCPLVTLSINTGIWGISADQQTALTSTGQAWEEWPHIRRLSLALQ